MAGFTDLTQPGDDGLLFRQSIEGCLASRIGAGGLAADEMAVLLSELEGPLADLQHAYRDGSLPHLRVPQGVDDLVAAEAAMARLCEGAKLVVF